MLIPFSIIVISFNNNELLTRCLNSIWSSLENNCEIILVDDGSRINQKEFVPKKFFDYRNFKYIRQENNGLSSARNKGLINAIGKYLIFIDGDDYVDSKSFCTFISSNLDKKDFDLIRVGYTRITKNKSKKYYVNNEYEYDNTNDYVRDVFIWSKLRAFSSWTHIYKRSFLLDNHLLFKNYFAEDLEHLINSYKYVKSILVTSYTYYIYDTNSNQNSIMKTKRDKISKHIIEFLDISTVTPNTLKLFLLIWYYLCFKLKYHKSIKGFFRLIFITPYLYFKK